MKATGLIKIEDGLELLNPIMELNKVNYDWKNHIVTLEVLFSEGAYNHHRSYEFNIEPNGEMTTSDIMSLVSNHDILSQFD